MKIHQFVDSGAIGEHISFRKEWFKNIVFKDKENIDVKNTKHIQIT